MNDKIDSYINRLELRDYISKQQAPMWPGVMLILVQQSLRKTMP